MLISPHGLACLALLISIHARPSSIEGEIGDLIDETVPSASFFGRASRTRAPTASSSSVPVASSSIPPVASNATAPADRSSGSNSPGSHQNLQEALHNGPPAPQVDPERVPAYDATHETDPRIPRPPTPEPPPPGFGTVQAEPLNLGPPSDRPPWHPKPDKMRIYQYVQGGRPGATEDSNNRLYKVSNMPLGLTSLKGPELMIGTRPTHRFLPNEFTAGQIVRANEARREAAKRYHAQWKEINAARAAREGTRAPVAGGDGRQAPGSGSPRIGPAEQPPAYGLNGSGQHGAHEGAEHRQSGEHPNGNSSAEPAPNERNHHDANGASAPTERGVAHNSLRQASSTTQSRIPVPVSRVGSNISTHSQDATRPTLNRSSSLPLPSHMTQTIASISALKRTNTSSNLGTPASHERHAVVDQNANHTESKIPQPITKSPPSATPTQHVEPPVKSAETYNAGQKGNGIVGQSKTHISEKSAQAAQPVKTQTPSPPSTVKTAQKHEKASVAPVAAAEKMPSTEVAKKEATPVKPVKSAAVKVSKT